MGTLSQSETRYVKGTLNLKMSASYAEKDKNDLKKGTLQLKRYVKCKTGNVKSEKEYVKSEKGNTLETKPLNKTKVC